MKIVLLLLILTLIGSQAFAEIYKWLDHNGSIVYSQTPPPADASSLKTPEINYSSGENEAAGKRAGEIINSAKEARNRREARQQQKKDAREKTALQKQLQQNCRRLRKNLQTMKREGRLYIRESDGNDRFLNERERSQKMQEAEENIKKYCTEAQ